MRSSFQAYAIGFGFIAIPLGATLLWGWPAGVLAAGVSALYYGVGSP